MSLHSAQIREFESAPWVLQRSCGCGKQSSECGCEGNKALRSAPPIVEDAMRSSGQPVEATTRADGFGHDFSKVRVHSQPNRLQRKPEEGSTPASTQGSTPAAAPSSTAKVPFCPTPEVLEGELNFKNEKTRQAWTSTNCLTDASRSMAPVCQFTKAQTQALADAQKIAADRVQRALGIINMGPKGKKMATELATDLFASDPPTPEEVVDRLTRTRDSLKAPAFAGSTCGDEGCQKGAEAYVTGPGAVPIHICPTAFSKPATLHTTVLHEALHLSGLDADPSTPEGYCKDFDCRTPCLDKEVADAWTHYLDCLGKPPIRTDFRDKIIDSVKDLP